MSYCVIALRDNFQFKSVFCRFNKDLETTLHTSYNAYSAVKCLVGLGDISLLAPHEVRSYCRDWGLNWQHTKPTIFYERQALLDRARASGISSVFIFEDRQWKRVYLSKSIDATYEFEAA